MCFAITRFLLLSEICADLDPYDFIDPNPEEEALSEGDTQSSTPYVSCIKVYAYKDVLDYNIDRPTDHTLKYRQIYTL